MVRRYRRRDVPDSEVAIIQHVRAHLPAAIARRVADANPAADEREAARRVRL